MHSSSGSDVLLLPQSKSFIPQAQAKHEPQFNLTKF